jgi:hypothetical protein
VVEKIPYSEKSITSGDYSETVIRTFVSDLNDEELKWHWDEEDRIIHPTNETNWRFQFDNELPIEIDSKIKVPKGTWHRLIKGDGDLTLIIEKIK